MREILSAHLDVCVATTASATWTIDDFDLVIVIGVVVRLHVVEERVDGTVAAVVELGVGHLPGVAPAHGAHAGADAILCPQRVSHPAVVCR